MKRRISALPLVLALALSASAQRLEVSFSIDHAQQRTTFRFGCWGGQLGTFALASGYWVGPGESIPGASGVWYLRIWSWYRFVELDARGLATVLLEQQWKPIERTAAFQGIWTDERGRYSITDNYVLIGQHDDVANGRPLAACYSSETGILRFAGRLVAQEVIEVWRRHAGGDWVRLSLHKLLDRDFDISTRIVLPPGSEIELRTVVTPATLLHLR